MELPDLVLVLIGAVMAAVTFVLVVMNRRRDHALRDRFAEEYDRILHEHGRDGR
jgi:NADH:ubiquinone oxidoreductase subunit 6 (subunit J)